MISIDKWTTIRSLHREGHSIRFIAKTIGVSKNTVKKAIRSEQPPTYTRKPKQNHALKEYETSIFQMMQKNLIGTRIYKELKKAGYTGSYCTVIRFINKHQKETDKKKTTIRFETEPGEQAQFDWSPYKVSIQGKIEIVYCFLTILGFSRKKHIVFSKSQKVEDVLDALEEGIRSFEGVPRQIVIDNARQLVLSHPRDQEALYHPLFLELAGIYRFQPYACQTYWPRTKGKVERPFYYIEQHFIKGNEFASFEELCQEGRNFINDWEKEVNQTTLEAPAERFEMEHPFLSPLPSITFSQHQKETRKVNWDCLFSFKGVKYSVPSEYAGEQVWV
ncbi:IS21 family transposase, partial [Bacillus cereus]|uniref:IS21 family transposase n=1 Tax=Bacillus cereus TaxID=1396 RepID=UPI0009533127